MFYGAGAEATIVIETVTALKVFDRIHQRAAVVLGVSRQGRIRWQVAEESQETRQTWNARVRLAWIDGLGNGGEFFSVVDAGQFDVARQRLLGPAIAWEGRFHSIHDGLQVRSGHDPIA